MQASGTRYFKAVGRGDKVAKTPRFRSKLRAISPCPHEVKPLSYECKSAVRSLCLLSRVSTTQRDLKKVDKKATIWYFLDMRKISLKALKEDLAGYAESAAGGEIVEVTKYNRPYIRMVTAQDADLLVGDLVHARQPLTRAPGIGKISLRKGGIEKLIAEDRDETQ